LITIKVAWVSIQDQGEDEWVLKSGFTVSDALGVLQEDPYMSSILKKRSGGVGVNGCVVSEQTVLEEGDRLEFYLPIVTDPKSARRQRGLHRKQIT